MERISSKLWVALLLLSCVSNLVNGTPVASDEQAVAGSNSTASDCPKLTHLATCDGKAYFLLLGNGRNWDGARECCKLFNMELASFESSFHSDCVARNIRTYGANGHYIWTAGKERSSIDNFHWTNTFAPIDIGVIRKFQYLHSPYWCLSLRVTNAEHSYYASRCTDHYQGMLCQNL